MIEGWYYLHTNGSLLYKRELGETAADIRDSDFARGLWPLDPTDRAGAWRILIESGAAGADINRVRSLAQLWACTDADAANYASHLDINIAMDGDQWCATPPWFTNLQESPAGFGASCLDAFIDLAKDIGYKPSKMWGKTFADLLREKPSNG